jgi:glyoxylase-like metal-dependent hydrolase (beta-lactamase superfamily II)
MGDMRIEATYTEWKDFGGVMAPAKIVQRRGELPFFEVNVTGAKANPADIAALIAGPAPAARGAGGAGAPGAGAPPAAPAGGAGAQGARGAGVPPVPGGAPPAAGAGGGGGRGVPAPVTSTSEKMADGVYRIMGGYVSLAVEFDDYIMVLEGPESDARGLSTIAETKKLIPNKPIRYVFNTHPHSDHSGGLGAFVAEGATIITHQNNKKFFEDAFSTPRTLLATNDTLAKAQADAKAKGQTVKVKVEGIGDKKVYKDSKHSVELYYMKTNLGTKKVPDYTPHSEGWMIAYLPKEKILFQGDFTVNPMAATQNDHVMQVFVPNVLDRLKLDFEKDVPVHPGNPNVALTRAEVLKAVGR